MSGRGFAGLGLVEGSSRARNELTPLKFVELERMQMGRGATNFGGEADRSGTLKIALDYRFQWFSDQVIT